MENLADLDVEVLRRVLDGDCRTGSLHNLAAYTDRSKALYTFNLNGETAGLHILLTDDAIEKARTMIDSLSFLQREFIHSVQREKLIWPPQTTQTYLFFR